MKVLKDKAGNQYIRIKEYICKLFYNPKLKLFSTWYNEHVLWINAKGQIVKKYDVSKQIQEYQFDNCKSSKVYFDGKRSCELCPSIALCQCSLNVQKYIPVKKEVKK